VIQAVVFDVDGTLVDSVDLHAESWRVALEKFGKRVTFDEVRRQIGKGADQLMPVFLSKEEFARFGGELDDYRSGLFKRDYLPRVKGFPRYGSYFNGLSATTRKLRLHRPLKGRSSTVTKGSRGSTTSLKLKHHRTMPNDRNPTRIFSKQRLQACRELP
jgi:hypothetical protein